MARPPGDVRMAIIEAVGKGPCTLLDIVQRSQVGYAAARYTVQHALRGGALQICGHEKRPHAKRWLAIYELVEPPELTIDGDALASADLGAAMSILCRASGVF